ncbi:MAG: hypothetical protein [Olavius algarvensis Delta 4 endosymbiont]|nr:MAG: hypothetical protein [Olavius algarvensis Delta 4 endosymbiont]
MAPTRRQRVVSSVFLMIVLVTVTSLIYRALPGNPQANRDAYRNPAEATQPLHKSMLTADRVVMMKGEVVTVKRTRLIYKGLLDGAICLDMFILDLDPQYPYPKQIPQTAAREGFRLGPGQYQLVTVNHNALTLKIIH